MAINKVVYDGEPLMDISQDTVTPATLMAGVTAHDANGDAIEGELEPVLSVNEIEPDEDGNVALDATDIPVGDGDTSTVKESLDLCIANIDRNNQFTVDNSFISRVTANSNTIHTKIAKLQKLKGKSVVLNQLVKTFTASDNEWHRVGTTISFEDGTVTITPTGTGPTRAYFTQYNLDTTHKYLARGYFKPSSASQIVDIGVNGFITRFTGLSDWSRYEKVVTGIGPTRNFVFEDVTSDTKNIIYGRNGEFIDLTQMFGSTVADTITTPEQAYALGCPREYIPYDTGTVVSAEVQSVESRKSDNTPIDTLTIPAAVRALEGYGWSAGTVYNEVDFEQKKFVKRVNMVKITDLVISLYNTHYFFATLEDNANYVDGWHAVNGLASNGYPVTYANDATVPSFCFPTAATMRIAMAEEYATVEALKDALADVYLYYELAEPVETDISALLPSYMIYEVEDGGSEEAIYPTGHMAVPVGTEITYDISLWDYVVTKQELIPDLPTIRSGAALGATALQSYTETDPTVPSWAKQSSKPTYTASEVGAVSKTGDTMTGNLSVDNNDISTGIFLRALGSTNPTRKGVFEYGGTNINLINRGDGTTAQQWLAIGPETSGITTAIQLKRNVGGVNSVYNLYGQHNQPWHELKATETTPSNNNEINWTYE